MQVLSIAVEALRAHKLRSFLTLLGVIIGVMTVVSVVSVISGLNKYVSEQVFQLNPDVFVVSKFGIITSREDFLEAIKRKSIDLEDIEAVKRLCRGCGAVGIQVQTQQAVKRGSERLPGVRVFGESANMANMNSVDLEEGRYFTRSEDSHATPVAVIGTDLREELFGRQDPIGRTVTVSGRHLKVIGLLRKQGSVLGQNQDNQLYMPLRTFQKLYGARRGLNIFVRPSGGLSKLQEVEDEVRVILRNRRHTPFRDKDPFGLVNAEGVQNVWAGISAGAFALMIFISGISLVVGGIVIMNIMLVSVVERTREIGIRRALGARSRDIQLQFLTEATLLSLSGGILGVLLGLAISKGISSVFPLPTLVRPSLIMAGLGISVCTGVLAGFFPARRAAQLQPVEAFRYE
jgi:putative ABC transport system permease protein